RGRVRDLARSQNDAGLDGEAASGLLDALDAAVRAEGDDARADVDRGRLDQLARLAHRDLRGAAADVDVHHARRLADRARGGARAEGRERGLERVARAHGDELAGLRGEK